MVKYLGIFLLVILATTANAQLKHDAQWVFGINAGLDFSQPGMVVPMQYICDTYENGASYSNKDGALVCYLSAYENTDDNVAPMQLRKRNGAVLDGGDSINTYGSCTAGALFLPLPNKEENEVYLLTSGLDIRNGCGTWGCHMLCFTKITTPINAEPYVTVKNQLVTNIPIGERLMAIRHANGTDWWVVTHKKGDTTYVGGASNTFLIFYFDSTGIHFNDSIQLGGINYNPGSAIGSVSVSRNGNLIAYGYENRGCEVFSFDRCNGRMNLLFDFPNLPWGYGTAFSPNERFLYISTAQDFPPVNQITQFDLWAPNPDSSRFNVTNNIDAFHKMALGLDGKIYISMGYKGYVGTIDHPDSLGSACGFIKNSVQLLPNAYSVHSLPQMPNYNLGPLPIYQANAGVDTFYCQGDSTIKALPIGGDSIVNITYQWQPAPGIDSLTARNQLVKPSQSRWYYVTITDTSYVGPSCNSRLDSVYVEVRVCTGITETATLQAKLYPNPTTGTLTIEIPGGQGGSIALYNLLGQLVLEAPLTSRSTVLYIDASPGIYLYQISIDGHMQNGKLVVE